MKEGCFEGCMYVSGLLRKYLQQFVIGGRVMTRNNKKVKLVSNEYFKVKNGKKSRRIIHKNNYKIVDFDAVSLYPSAMKAMYYPSG